MRSQFHPAMHMQGVSNPTKLVTTVFRQRYPNTAYDMSRHCFLWRCSFIAHHLMPRDTRDTSKVKSCRRGTKSSHGYLPPSSVR